KALGDRLSKQLLLTVKVPVKTPVRQIELAHQVGDRDSLSTLTPEVARRGPHDALTCLLFVLGGISHINLHGMIYIIYNHHVNWPQAYRLSPAPSAQISEISPYRTQRLL